MVLPLKYTQVKINGLFVLISLQRLCCNYIISVLILDSAYRDLSNYLEKSCNP